MRPEQPMKRDAPVTIPIKIWRPSPEHEATLAKLRELAKKGRGAADAKPRRRRKRTRGKGKRLAAAALDPSAGRRE